MVKESFIALTLIFTSTSLLASEHEGSTAKYRDSISFDARFGFSPYLGIIGLEIQKEHYALGLGLPGNLGFTYYDKPQSDSIFYSVGIGQFSDDEYNDTKDGVYYTDFESQFFSAGAGYRWYWPSGWNITASLSIQFSSDEYKNSYQVLEEDVVILFPGLMAGYVF